MIIKLHPSLHYARHKEVRQVKPLPYKDKVKGDRWVMIILFILTIVLSAIFS